jgi:hypothetical protein
VRETCCARRGDPFRSSNASLPTPDTRGQRWPRWSPRPEDLDFTVMAPAQLDRYFLFARFKALGSWLYDTTGIEVPAELLRFDVYNSEDRGQSRRGAHRPSRADRAARRRPAADQARSHSGRTCGVAVGNPPGCRGDSHRLYLSYFMRVRFGPGSDRRIHGPPIALAQAFASMLMQRLHDADQHPLEDPRAVAGAVVARTVDHIR